MAEVDQLQQRLLTAQNADGGWAFRTGSTSSSSWTEPTALALLSLGTTNAPALAWLLRHQNPDGGWSPNPTVPVSTWVTSLAVLALPKTPEHRLPLEKGMDWLRRSGYPEASLLQRALLRFGIVPPKAPGGVPWFPGTAGWVIPTSLCLLALSQMAAFEGHSDLSARLRESQSYLLAHRCPDGGWNHGGSLFRSENSNSYPETTGLALLALSGTPLVELHQALHLAESFLAHPGSLEGLSWLQMGLSAHARSVTQPSVVPQPRTTRDVSLRLLALSAAAGKNPLMPNA